ncbi:YheU family protein [Psychrobium sp. 1_MG-2023]|uniref:YheU family protein n=1 Tax=Psychrobium sp. 1_MG-2023 TaxID=3062624 RepID=UPI000C31C0A9|nr:YheU family protein [Psychrobium sp. 1_MG-2023]MDP2560819.1 YheU family protein [Psychrobium sp. 1_MG-2023]PKF56694.1 hypothetical protein CW748_09450 [Alteromonadales bacterium alter-6D02]
MIIPFQQLDPDTLDNLLSEHVLREGTDYGESEVPLASKIAQLKQQLINQEIVLVYSELHESVNLIPAAQFNQAQENQE